MTRPISISDLLLQGGNATTRQAPPANPNPNPSTDQDLQNAARELRDAIRNNVTTELGAAARARAAAQGIPASPPPSPHTFTIRGPDGKQTVIGVDDPFGNSTIPPQVVDISVAFFITVAAIIIGLPLARAFARRMDRRSTPAEISPQVTSQLAQLNQAVDAIALEVERISENQRFATRLLTEQRDAQLPSTQR
jgi:hypothetical protein